MDKNYYNEFFSDLPEYTEIFVNKSVDIAKRIEFLIKQNGLTQRKFAELLGKEESEISKWLCGTHNFTLKTLSKIEDILNSSVIDVPANMEFITVSNGNNTFNFNSKDSSCININELEKSKKTLSSPKLCKTFFMIDSTKNPSVEKLSDIEFNLLKSA
jgi:transcriptional regulator with XRE-family HTH domain